MDVKKTVQDIGIGIAVTAGFHFTSCYFDFFERLHTFSRQHEGWDMDEYFLTFGFALMTGGVLFERFKERILRSKNEKIERRYQMIAQNLDDVIATLNPTTLMTSQVTPSIRNLTGYSPNEYKKLSLEEKMTSKSVKRIINLVREIRDKQISGGDGDYILELEHIRKDKSKVFADARMKPFYDERGNLIEIVSVIRDATQRKENEKMLLEMSLKDELTQIGNRKSFMNELKKSLKYAKRYENTRALFYVDLDGFKQVNDNYGHESGDQLLVNVAYRIKSSLRDTDSVFRLGGDEFAVILNNTYNQEPQEVARRLHSSLSCPYDLDENCIDFVSASIGISLFPSHTIDLQQLISYANQAMYKAKKENLQVCIYS